MACIVLQVCPTASSNGGVETWPTCAPTTNTSKPFRLVGGSRRLRGGGAALGGARGLCGCMVQVD